MPTAAVRKKRIENYETINKILSELDKRYGDKIASIISMGSWGTEEATKENDVDLEIIFGTAFFKEELASELNLLIAALNLPGKVVAWAIDEKSIKSKTFSTQGYPKNILCGHIFGTGVVLRGKNFLEHFRTAEIPEDELPELLGIAKKDFAEGECGKAVLKAAYATVLKTNGGKPIEIKNHLYYRSICEAAQKYFSEKDFAFIYSALRAKRGLATISKEEAEKFINKIGAPIGKA